MSLHITAHSSYSYSALGRYHLKKAFSALPRHLECSLQDIVRNCTSVPRYAPRTDKKGMEFLHFCIIEIRHSFLAIHASHALSTWQASKDKETRVEKSKSLCLRRSRRYAQTRPHHGRRFRFSLSRVGNGVHVLARQNTTQAKLEEIIHTCFT